MRRISFVSVSVPSNLKAGCHTHTVLILLEHKYHINQDAVDYTVSQSLAGSKVLRTERVPIASITDISGAGVFKLDFRHQSANSITQRLLMRNSTDNIPRMTEGRR